MPRSQQILEYLANTDDTIYSKNASILLEALQGNSQKSICEKYSIHRNTITYIKRKWLLLDLESDTWEEGLAKAKNALKLSGGRPKIIKAEEESKIIEIGECSKQNREYKSVFALCKEVAEVAKLEGLPDCSTRTIERILTSTY